MKSNEFIEWAKAEVVKYHNHHQDPVICIDESLVYVVWSCKTLQNHKALLGVAKPDGGMYYEVTYNGDRGEMYFDAYKKEKNICIPIDERNESAPQKVDCKMKPCALGDTEHRSPYYATVAGMLSPDYKERFKAEYQQTKIRYEKLKAFNARIEAAQLTRDMKSQCDEPKHDCPAYLLRDQEETMGRYLHILEIRAVIEGIEF